MDVVFSVEGKHEIKCRQTTMSSGQEQHQDAILRYARGADRRDMDLVRSTYHPDAYDDHGDYKGGVDGLIEWIAKRHANISQSMHFLGNCLIEFLGDDIALVETYFSRRRVTAVTESKSEVIDNEALGRYVDRFERRKGEWKIAHRVVVYDAVLMPSVPSPPRSSSWAWARRDPHHVLFQMRNEAMIRCRNRRCRRLSGRCAPVGASDILGNLDALCDFLPDLAAPFDRA